MTCFVWMKPGYPETPRRHGRSNARLSPRTMTRDASSRSLKLHSLRALAAFTVPTGLQPSSEFRRRLLTPRSRNCKSARAASSSGKAGTHKWKRDFRENPDSESVTPNALSIIYQRHSACTGKDELWRQERDVEDRNH